MREINVNECPFLKGLMMEMTSYCPDCGSKRKQIAYNNLPQEPKMAFADFKSEARFLHCPKCGTYSIINDD